VQLAHCCCKERFVINRPLSRIRDLQWNWSSSTGRQDRGCGLLRASVLTPRTWALFWLELLIQDRGQVARLHRYKSGWASVRY
jgi:hypothetical protein